MILVRKSIFASIAFTGMLPGDLVVCPAIRPPRQGDDDAIVESNQSKPLSLLTAAPTETTIGAMRRCCLAVLLVGTSAFAQTMGKASFAVYEKGKQVGTLDTSVSRTDEGWRIQSSMQTKGSVPVRIVNLDLLYDRNWFGRWMTMEMKQPDNVIVHVAVGRTTAQTDVVRPTEARFQSSSVSPNTILLPERAYGAYEAVAARLSKGSPSGDLPLFVAPIGETRAMVDGVTTEQVRTTRGSITATHYVLTEIRTRPTRVDLWADRGRLLRLDLPGVQVSIVRTDVRP